MRIWRVPRPSVNVSGVGGGRPSLVMVMVRCLGVTRRSTQMFCAFAWRAALATLLRMMRRRCRPCSWSENVKAESR